MRNCKNAGKHKEGETHQELQNKDVLTGRSGDSITGRSDEGHTGRSGGYILRKNAFSYE